MPIRTISRKSKVGKKARQKHASRVISEVMKGNTIARTRRKFGKKRAQAQAIAIGLRAAGLSRRKRRKT